MRRLWIVLSFTCVIVLTGQVVQANPPFSGTIFIDPDIITSSDRTAFQGVSYAGQGLRLMFDRRSNSWIHVNAYLFNASFDDGLTCEIQVNPEFGGSVAALAEAQKYGSVIGRLPTALRLSVETVWIHQGTQLFGGGNNNLLIHTGQADLYESEGILEEALVHEASHTSLDAAHAAAPGWLAAQVADGEFISAYARDFPSREDIAESFLPYLAIRHRSNRISALLADTIGRTIPNRLAYFDAQTFNMYPLAGMMLRLDVRETSFESGETLLVDVIGAYAGPAMSVDAYIGMIAPADTSSLFGCASGDVVVLLQEGGAGLVARCASNGLQNFGRVAQGVTIPEDLPVTFVPEILRFTWPMGFPGGSYTVFVALTRADALGDGSVDVGDIVAVGAAQVSFAW